MAPANRGEPIFPRCDPVHTHTHTRTPRSPHDQVLLTAHKIGHSVVSGTLRSERSNGTWCIMCYVCAHGEKASSSSGTFFVEPFAHHLNNRERVCCAHRPCPPSRLTQCFHSTRRDALRRAYNFAARVFLAHLASMYAEGRRQWRTLTEGFGSPRSTRSAADAGEFCRSLFSSEHVLNHAVAENVIAEDFIACSLAVLSTVLGRRATRASASKRWCDACI